MTIRRRALSRDNLDVETTLRRAVEQAPEIELGWSVLRQEMRDAGWPSRLPDGDQKTGGGGDSEPSDSVKAWRCDCGNTFATLTGATAHMDRSGHAVVELVTTGHRTAGVVHADPVGDMATRLNALTGDLEALQDHWHIVRDSLRAIALIARKHIPASSPAVPACAVTTCSEHVEYTAGGGFRGMERIAGMWVAKPGVRPLCARHRTDERRGVA